MRLVGVHWYRVDQTETLQGWTIWIGPARLSRFVSDVYRKKNSGRQYALQINRHLWKFGSV